MRRKFDLYSSILRNAEAGNGGGTGGLVAAAGGAAPAAAPPAAPSGAAAAPAAPPQGAGAAASAAPADPAAKPAAAAAAAMVYVPDGLPDSFKGASERETIDKLWGHLKANQPPAKPEDYAITVPKGLEGVMDPKTDPVLPLYRAVAQKHGLSQAQFDGVMGDLFGEMTKQGIMQKPLDVAAEFRSLSDGSGDPAAQLAAGKRVAVELGNSIGALATRGVISKEAAAELAGPMLANAAQFKAMRELVAALEKNPAGLNPSGQAGGTGSGISEAERRLRAQYPTEYQKQQ